MRNFLCQNTNIVTREENSKVFESHYEKRSIRTAGKQTNKQTNKKQNKGPANKVSNFQEAAGDIRVPIRNKERKCLSHAHRALQSRMTVPFMFLKS